MQLVSLLVVALMAASSTATCSGRTGVRLEAGGVNCTYWYYPAGVTHADAEAKCVDDGGRLAIIHSKELEDQLLFAFNMGDREGNGQKSAWIGMQYRNGTHQWDDDSASEHRNWDPNTENSWGPEPNYNSDQEPVTVMNGEWTQYRGWYDLPLTGFTAATLCQKCPE